MRREGKLVAYLPLFAFACFACFDGINSWHRQHFSEFLQILLDGGEETGSGQRAG